MLTEHALVEAASRGDEPKYCSRCGAALELRLLKASERERLVCPRCGYIAYLDPKVVAGVVVARGAHVLLLRRAHEPLRGAWVFPSGYVERGEPVEAAAVREAREEVGLEVGLGLFLGAYSYVGAPVVVLVWLGSAEGEPVAGEEALEIRWFEADAIPWSELAFQSTHDALERWLGREVARSEVPGTP